MHIGLNGQKLSDKHPAGPEKYTKHIYEALAKVDKTNTYTIYVDQPSDKIDLQISNPNFLIKYVEKDYSWTQYSLARQLLKDKPDIFFTPVHTMPIIRSLKTKYVGMIHGLEFNFNTDRYPFGGILKGKHEWYVSKFSDALIVPSNATKNAILKTNWGIPFEKITVIEEGVGENFYKRSQEEVSGVKKKYFLKDGYLIFISTIQPRKNLPRLIEAFSEALKQLTNKETQLVVVGKLGWAYEDSANAPQKFGVEKNVKFLGRIPDEDVPALISGAAAYVNPSLEEGFGLPLLESMSCGTPCLVSAIDAHKELGKDTVKYFDPENVLDIKIKFWIFTQTDIQRNWLVKLLRDQNYIHGKILQ